MKITFAKTEISTFICDLMNCYITAQINLYITKKYCIVYLYLWEYYENHCYQVVGSKMPRYRLFGDTVDVAAMMNTTGEGDSK